VDRNLPSPIARWSHMVGVVAIDVPAPEATLTTLTPIGAHLVVHLRTAQAAELYERLRRLLEPQGRVVTGDDFADMSMRELIDVDGGDRVSVRRGERKTSSSTPVTLAGSRTRPWAGRPPRC